jgi:hypothetical protein
MMVMFEICWIECHHENWRDKLFCILLTTNPVQTISKVKLTKSLESVTDLLGSSF